ncbi:breast cancer suppressor brct [Trichoderma arundinaceum]|uniref:Breast cancer suppressor brct n=1 Tax=Trichoderma arundinaceum TaxID=490622 RepID=A0A395N8I4_TRIAR|nr:breast cancer suppressor brct [Trichoderma arundinaceum]
MRSPPKRLTRARAAKDPEPAATSKPTKIVTAAAKARASVPSTLTASTKSTAAKRKTRSDDADEEERQASLAKRPRGRPPKKPAEEEGKGAAMAVTTTTASAVSEPGRAGRPRATVRKGITDITKEESTAPKPGRGRPRKVEPKPEEGENQPEPAKKTARGRPATVMKSASSTTTTANKPPIKKVVKFREPDKENVEPAAAPKEPATAGMRGRPARRGGAAAARTARPVTKATKPQAGDKKPLSPKKITQLTLSQYDSEDELALEKVSTKPLAKGPIKPPSKKSENIPFEIEHEATTVAVNTAMFDLPEVTTTFLASPARRPTSPPRDTLKSPAKRIAVPLPGSALKLSNEPVAQTPFKGSTLLQSAAKRPQSPIKPFIFSAQKEQPSESTTKLSMLQSPAKRAMPGFKSLLDSRQPDLPTLDESPAATPTRAAKSSKKLMMEEEVHEDTEDDPFAGPIENPQFSMRVPIAPPQDADSNRLEAETEEEEAEAEAEAEAEEAEAETEEDEAEAEVEEEVQEVVETEAEIVAEVEFEDTEEDEPPQVTEIPETLANEEEANEVVEESIIVATEEQESEDEEAPVEDEEDDSEDTMVLDELVAEEEPTESPPKAETPAHNPLYQLRQKDLDPCHDLSSASDSEDDTLPFERITGTPSISGEKTPRTRASRSPLKQSRRSTLGFTALSDQLGSWSAASPVKSAHSFVVETEPVSAEEDESPEDGIEPLHRDTPMKNAFSSNEALVENVEEQTEDVEAMITDEDVALAQEANEMSLMDPMESEDGSSARHSFDDSLSDASQEYGDENQVPVDGAAPSSQPQAPPVTPVGRPMTRSFNTTTKVPLKPADDSTPSPLKKKSFSASRAAPKRPSQPRRGAPVVSYSPDKPRRRSLRNVSTISEEPEQSAEPSTPAAKMDMWTSIGTPARTPRKDLNPILLRGAIVFVDVHTSEGADASGIFVELLTQMGARCPQKWNWNPSNANNNESTKVGITHVVFKDGSKRTLEKVREANGVVQCVGVSWVLDCERDNEWLDESPYNIDTSSVPRGGARRRKSMEPKAISNMNGSVVNSSSKERRESAPASPSTPNRRQSSIWIHTPSDAGEEKEEEEVEWSNLILTPVPKTPAPETVMKFATETPSNIDEDEDEDDEEDESLTREEMLTRTCPPKAQKFVQLGGGILSKDKDEHVLLRLMAARRKSLQFAPKVGSPLAKMWR